MFYLWHAKSAGPLVLYCENCRVIRPEFVRCQADKVHLMPETVTAAGNCILIKNVRHTIETLLRNTAGATPSNVQKNSRMRDSAATCMLARVISNRKAC